MRAGRMPVCHLHSAMISTLIEAEASAKIHPDTLARLLGHVCIGLLERRGDALAVKDVATGRYVHANAAMLAWLGEAGDSLMGASDADVFPAAMATAFRAAEQTAMAQPEALASEHGFDWLGARREFAVLRTVSPPDATGRRWITSVWTDTHSERQRQAQLQRALEQLEQGQRTQEGLQRQLADHALRDAATGLHTRAHFEEQLRREVDLSAREHREFSIVTIEIDPPGPKLLAAGPDTLPTVLAAVGRLLRAGTRAMDSSCRLEDKRFGILLSGVGLATAHSRMEGLRRRGAAEIVVHQGQDLGYTLSVGVASYPHTAQSQDELVAACTKALEEAKRRGGNHVTLASIGFPGA
jgi:diguanylate cyclase (GGDEF)-like protein